MIIPFNTEVLLCERAAKRHSRFYLEGNLLSLCYISMSVSLSVHENNFHERRNWERMRMCWDSIMRIEAKLLAQRPNVLKGIEPTPAGQALW
jgi:hypothetical protein